MVFFFFGSQPWTMDLLHCNNKILGYSSNSIVDKIWKEMWQENIFRICVKEVLLHVWFKCKSFKKKKKNAFESFGNLIYCFIICYLILRTVPYRILIYSGVICYVLRCL